VCAVAARPFRAFTLKRGAPRLRAVEEGPEKFCAYCGEWWPTECFTTHPLGVGGLDNRCNACRQEMRKGRGWR